MVRNSNREIFFGRLPHYTKSSIITTSKHSNFHFQKNGAMKTLLSFILEYIFVDSALQKSHVAVPGALTALLDALVSVCVTGKYWVGV